jgi:hypothetical protein
MTRNNTAQEEHAHRLSAAGYRRKIQEKLNQLPLPVLANNLVADTLADPLDVKYAVLQASDFPLAGAYNNRRRERALSLSELRQAYLAQENGAGPGGVPDQLTLLNNVKTLEKDMEASALNRPPPSDFGAAALEGFPRGVAFSNESGDRANSWEY